MAELADHYKRRFGGVLLPLAPKLQTFISDHLVDFPRVDRVQARAKSVDRFLEKSKKRGEDGQLKYSEPMYQIQDQVGVRIICFYASDVLRISETIERYFKQIESKDLIPESESEFGYFGRHYVMIMPTGLADPNWDPSLVPEFFELQIKTLFQHAWAEANHDLGYKPLAGELSKEDRRKLAFASAQAWGADHIFDELHRSFSKES